MSSSALVWLRRDLRSSDHAALAAALARHERVWCAFVFDTEILDALPSRRDRRVEFIWNGVAELDRALRDLGRTAGGPGGGVIVRHGAAREEIVRLAASLGVCEVFANLDYEPAAIARDCAVARSLGELGIAYREFKDQVVFERDEVLTREGRPYSVFTPYRNSWLLRLQQEGPAEHAVAPHAARLASPAQGERIPTLAQIGFEPTNLAELGLPCGMSGARELLDDFLGRMDAYAQRRDYPARKGPSYLSVHLRFGTVAVRELVRHALARDGEGPRTWLNELIWREFYQMILAHHPHVVDASFKPEYDALRWEDDPSAFAAWCEGRTGYPIVDAAMRQLNQTGYMHNRLRMVAASFLTKDLGIDWRAGERYFARHLNDYDLASNNGGWQWAASTGCDAQPYFRIFNPVSQSKRFDPEGAFIRRYLPELGRLGARQIHAPWRLSPAEQAATGVQIGRDYPPPIVDHATARARTLERYRVARPI